MSTTRRRVLQTSLAGGAGLVAARYATDTAAAAPRPPSPALPLTKFVQPLQVMPAVDLRAGGTYTLTATPDTKKLHPAPPAPTSVWQYKGDPTSYIEVNAGGPYAGYLGPTLVMKRGYPVTMNYVHALGATYPAWLPVDRNLSMTHNNQIRLLTHLHGGFVWGQHDGNPAVDMGYADGETQTVWYGNEQQASLIWYHDHGMGNTRLNVWAGLAGGVVMRDDIDTGAADNLNGLPVGYGSRPGDYEVPLVLQDRAFARASGDFYYPTQALSTVGSWGHGGNDPNEYGASTGPWIGEGFGDNMLVNGIVEPYHNVEARLYRFRVLNGCNARILDLQLTATPKPRMWIIGSDGGLLPAPVLTKTLTMMPGERLDVLIDFTGLPVGTLVTVRNTNLNGFYVSPAPALADCMQFRVVAGVTSTVNNTVPLALQGGSLANVPKADSIGVRSISLDEWNANLSRWYMTVTGSGAGGVVVAQSGFGALPNGTPGGGGNLFDDPIGELPPLGKVMEWDFVNNTMDSHPMHMHLVQFQVVSRRNLGAVPPADGTNVQAWEKGWKDTVSVHPQMITRVRVRFDMPSMPPNGDPVAVPPIPPFHEYPANFMAAGTSPKFNLAAGEAERCYVYHCHLLEHEDNEMMRPFRVV